MGVDTRLSEVDGPEVRSWTAARLPSSPPSISRHRAQSAARRFGQVLRSAGRDRRLLGEFAPMRAASVPSRDRFRHPMIAARYSLGTGRLRARFRGPGLGCMNDVARLWSAGFALGASFEIRWCSTKRSAQHRACYSDGYARHKGARRNWRSRAGGLPLLGAYRSERGGHKLNHAVLTALMVDRSAWRVVEAESARRPRGHVEAGAGMVGGMVAPAYGPDVS
jgi:UDP-3-O-[3-hydroxymyristoyl] N-acetylglucosamine deacetylase